MIRYFVHHESECLLKLEDPSDEECESLYQNGVEEIDERNYNYIAAEFQYEREERVK